MCGIFGVFGHPEAANLTYLGLYALQHRGQESAGIVAADGRQLRVHRGMGYVADVFRAETLRGLAGPMAIGHVRYSTAGASTIENAQPIVVRDARGPLAVAHNGNLVNAVELREELERQGSIFQSGMDTEVIPHLMARSRARSLADRVAEALRHVQGAYSCLFLSEDSLIAARDPNGFRPLILGRLGDAWILSSETCALDLIEARFEREVEPGEVLVITEGGLRSLRPFPPGIPVTRCIFEAVYFARPDSRIPEGTLYEVRKRLGRQLAIEQPAEADIVIPVPDSGVPAAIGYAQQAGLPFETGLVRNHYVGRTFIEPRQSIRHFGVKVKLNAVRDVLEGKRVVVVDDSIVRGTTARKIIKMLRQAGAREIHFRISSPPTLFPCYYGIDTPTRAELIASSHTIEEIRQYVTADTLGYLSLEGLRRAVDAAGRVDGPFCDACFSGRYPVRFPGMARVAQLPLFPAPGIQRAPAEAVAADAAAPRPVASTAAPEPAPGP
ncbi:MAG TPA: amidophosphoribosyltransferase, partial [Thermodesulfobacteriota bacterium]|nr:amidophosphoribosyltransferase [Thermodesulfobacteriota bacterium]